MNRKHNGIKSIKKLHNAPGITRMRRESNYYFYENNVLVSVIDP